VVHTSSNHLDFGHFFDINRIVKRQLARKLRLFLAEVLLTVRCDFLNHIHKEFTALSDHEHAASSKGNLSDFGVAWERCH
jgi:hypothetical protein